MAQEFRSTPRTASPGEKWNVGRRAGRRWAQEGDETDQEIYFGWLGNYGRDQTRQKQRSPPTVIAQCTSSALFSLSPSLLSSLSSSLCLLHGLTH